MNASLYCVIGDPISHSLSPAIHNAAFAKLGINAIYLAVRVRKEELGQAIAHLKILNVKGINVTIPHKVEIIKYLDKLDETAKAIGAVNTIVNKNGKLIGYNTDAAGALIAIKKKVKNLKGKTAVILGAGGAARAVSFALNKEGAIVRMLSRQEIAEELPSLIHEANILCNCTPAGMHEGDSLIPKHLLRKGLVVFDAVYKKGSTKLIRDAEAAGCVTISGEEMLVNQGAIAFELWVGKKPNVGIMLEAVSKSLRSKYSKSNIYLIGFMGSGKTSVGKALAKKLKMKYIDVDEQIERRARKTIARIFEEGSEHKFRKMEKNAIVLASKIKNSVIAVGGGAVLDYINSYRMQQTGKVILLRASPQTIVKRLEGESTRPLLLGLNKKQRLERTKKLLKLREPFYALAKQFEVSTNEKRVEEIADEIRCLL